MQVIGLETKKPSDIFPALAKEVTLACEEMQKKFDGWKFVLDEKERVVDAREAGLNEREIKLTNREAAIEQIRMQLSLKKTELAAALEREKKEQDKRLELLQERNALKERLDLIDRAFPGIAKTSLV